MYMITHFLAQSSQWLNSLLLGIEISMSKLWNPDYLHHPEVHLSSFWVPAVLTIAFVIFAFTSLTKGKIVVALILLVLAAACFFFIVTGEQSAVLTGLEDLANH